MDFVDDVDLVAAARRRVLDVLPDGPHVVDLAIRCRVDFDDVHERPGLGLHAHRARAARLGARPFRTQQRLGEQARGRRLADAPRPGEEVGVGNAAGDERVLQRPRDRVLADDRLERLRPPLSCEHLITHQRYLTGRLRDAEPRVPITRAKPGPPITRHQRCKPSSRSDAIVVAVHPPSIEPSCDLPVETAPARYSHGTREGRLTVAPFRAWRGSTILVAWGPAFNAARRGSLNTARPREGIRPR